MMRYLARYCLLIIFMITESIALSPFIVSVYGESPSPKSDTLQINVSGTIETKTDSHDSTSELKAVADIATMTMESYEKNFNLIKDIGLLVMGLVGTTFAVLAIFGIREFRNVTKPFKTLKEESEKLVSELNGMKEDLAVFHNEQQKHFKEAKTTAMSLIFIGSASLHIASYLGTGKDAYLKNAAIELERIFEKPDGDPKLLGWAYNMKGFIAKRFGTLAEALELCEKATSYDEKNHTAWYNAASYACVLGKKDKTLAHLAKAIELNPRYKDEAPQDDDFQSIVQDEEFRQLTPQG